MSLVAALLLACWALSLAVVSGVAIVRAVAAGRGGPGPDPDAPSLGAGLDDVWLVRPCCGDEPGLTDRLVSGAALGVRQIFTVARAEDAAWPVASAAAESLRAAGVPAEARVVPTAAPNQKAGQWLGLLAAPDLAACTIFVNVDSDVHLAGFDLQRLIAPLRAEGVGATWCPPVEVAPPAGLGDRASQAFLNASLHAFRLLGGLDPHGLVGKVCALHLPRVRAAGGLVDLDILLGEDMELARRLRLAGLEAPTVAQPSHPAAQPIHPAAQLSHPAARPIYMVAQPVRSEARGRSLAAAVARYARWLTVIRAQRAPLMASYPLLFGATLPLCLLAIPLGYQGLAAACVALTARLAVAVAGRRLGGLRVGPLTAVVDVVLGELVTWAAWLQAMRRREVVWRGQRLIIPRGGGALRAGPPLSPPSGPPPAG